MQNPTPLPLPSDYTNNEHIDGGDINTRVITLIEKTPEPSSERFFSKQWVMYPSYLGYNQLSLVALEFG